MRSKQVITLTARILLRYGVYILKGKSTRKRIAPTMLAHQFSGALSFQDIRSERFSSTGFGFFINNRLSLCSNDHQKMI
jgi:hypothetical protein